MKKNLKAGAAMTLGIALALSPTVAMAASAGLGVGAIGRPTATLVNHAPYGKVYQLQAAISGTATGNVVRILNANNQPAAGFTPFKLGSPITTYTVYYNPGSLAGQYKVEIGSQISAPVQLNAIPAATAAHA